MKVLFLIGVAIVSSLVFAVRIGARRKTPRRRENCACLIIDGQNPNHDWQVTTPLLKQILEASGRFTVDVATAPIPAGYKSRRRSHRRRSTTATSGQSSPTTTS